MLSKYKDTLSHPGAALFSSTGLWPRLPMSMTGLGIVLLVEQRTGSYGAAGLMSALYVLAAAACAPIQGRLIDRIGQTRVLWWGGAIYAAGMVAFLTALERDLAAPLPHLALMVTGMATPQAGSMIRARWTAVLQDREQLNTAFSLEAVIDELAFIVGPVLVTFLTLSVADVSGLLFAAAAALGGCWALALQRSTAPQPGGHSTSARESLRWNLLGPLVTISLMLGIIFGSAEVIIAALTKDQGHDSAAGLVLAIWAFGSLLAGVIVGGMARAQRPLVRLRTSLFILAVLFAPFMLLTSIPVLAIGMFFGGFMISPSLICLVHLIEHTMPPSRLTEALTWSSTGMSAGIAPGAAFAGMLVDSHGPSSGFVVPLAAGLIGVAVACASRIPD
jgi:MFS family permease